MNIVLWADNDHKNRAELLAKTYGDAVFNFLSTKPRKIDGADTLTFWGHGDANHFCHSTSETFMKVVSGWISANKGVNCVELISCNLRHRQGTYSDSFTMQLVSKMKRRHAKITFKALPVALTRMGVTCENSILKWQPASQTWAYVATPGKDDRYMWAICIMLEDRMPPRGIFSGYVNSHNSLARGDYMENHKFGKNQHGAIITSDDCSPKHALCLSNNAFVMTGTIGTLRSALVDIR